MTKSAEDQSPQVSTCHETPRGRIALALSILRQRRFCKDCALHADQAVLALLGASIDEIRRVS